MYNAAKKKKDRCLLMLTVLGSRRVNIRTSPRKKNWRYFEEEKSGRNRNVVGKVFVHLEVRSFIYAKLVPDVGTIQKNESFLFLAEKVIIIER